MVTTCGCSVGNWADVAHRYDEVFFSGASPTTSLSRSSLMGEGKSKMSRRKPSQTRNLRDARRYVGNVGSVDEKTKMWLCDSRFRGTASSPRNDASTGEHNCCYCRISTAVGSHNPCPLAMR